MDWRKVAKFLFGGLLVIGLLIGGYLFWYYETGQNVVDGYPSQPEIKSKMCTGRAGESCEAGAEFVDLSEIEDCSLPGNSTPPILADESSMRDLPSVEDVNESTGIVTCETD